MDLHKNPRILIVLKCQNSWLEYFDTVNKFIEKKMQESITTMLWMNARRSYQTIQDIGQRRWRSTSSRQCSASGQLTNGYQFWQRVEDRRKGSNIAWIRTIFIDSCTFEQSKDIQEVQSILQCKTMYCYQKVLPSFFKHVGNGKDLRSTVNHGLIPGGISLRTGRQAVFFTVGNPMDNQDGPRVKPFATCHKQESRHTKNTWKHFQNTLFWCNLKLAQQRGLQFYQTRSNAVILYDTLPA